MTFSDFMLSILLGQEWVSHCFNSIAQRSNVHFIQNSRVFMVLGKFCYRASASFKCRLEIRWLLSNVQIRSLRSAIPGAHRFFPSFVFARAIHIAASLTSRIWISLHLISVVGWNETLKFKREKWPNIIVSGNSDASNFVVWTTDGKWQFRHKQFGEV